MNPGAAARRPFTVPLRARILTALTLAFIPALLYSYASGPDPRHTGAPGDQTCAQSGCHTGTSLNGGGGNVQLTSSTGTTYTPGQQQTLTIKITDSKARVYGFQMSARLDSNGTNGQAGNFTAGSRQIVICDNGSLKGSSGCPSNAPVQFIEHNTPFTTSTINVTWTAPSSNVGTVTIYVAANAANGDGNSTGDHIYTTKLQLSPAVTSTGNKPTISSGGVVSASAFNAKAGIAPGTWVEIFGNNLATTTRLWQGSDFSGNNAPTSLDGVSVTIGGKKAYVDYVSPGQVDIQVPDGIPIGAGVPLVLTNSQGQSDAYSLQTSDLAPAILAPASFVVSGKSYVVATFPTNDPNNIVYVGNTGAISGVNMRPAKSGDVITMYGIGFGPVSPTTGAGVIDTQATNLTNALKILFGQTEATVLYAGLAPNFVGLYQFNVQVPNVSANDWPVSIQVGGTTVAQNVFITTGQ
jgi:uncharacterized protein (TIGR03437 family)